MLRSRRASVAPRDLPAPAGARGPRVLAGLVAGAALTTPAAPATSEPLRVGAWLGPRIFSDDSELGRVGPDAASPSIANSMALGGRLGLALPRALTAEVELAFAPTETTLAPPRPRARVFWLDPRLQLRIDLRRGHRLQPFVLVGGGAPFVLSTRSKTLASDMTGAGYAGGGVRFDTHKGFVMRLDARVAFVPALESVLAPELDLGIGIELALGGRRARAGAEQLAGALPADRDGDGVTDPGDACPDRPEDRDGFDDLDGCPDIDNDADRVLDVADRCVQEPESYNGFQDDDGCPDALPVEVDQLRGTIEGLLYAEGETLVRDSAQPSLARIAKVMAAHASIRVVLIGHADSREAEQLATTEPGEIAPDLAALASDLSRARAEAVKQALGAAGVITTRIDVEGRGSEEPVADNDKPRGRLANRRVEIKLYVPPSGRVR
jgi:OOP family OmpA-OmpF porin